MVKCGVLQFLVILLYLNRKNLEFTTKPPILRFHFPSLHRYKQRDLGFSCSEPPTPPPCPTSCHQWLKQWTPTWMSWTLRASEARRIPTSLRRMPTLLRRHRLLPGEAATGTLANAGMNGILIGGVAGGTTMIATGHHRPHLLESASTSAAALARALLPLSTVTVEVAILLPGAPLQIRPTSVLVGMTMMADPEVVMVLVIGG